MKRKVYVGYTLVELLVVLGIVAALISILATVVINARNNALASVCVSNLSQLDHALAMYVADDNGAYPPIVSNVSQQIGDNLIGHYTPALFWESLLTPYVGHRNLLTCPLTVDPELRGLRPGMGGLTGYGYNVNLSTVTGFQVTFSFIGTQENVLEYPADTVAIFDVRAGVFGCSAPDVGGAAEVHESCMYITNPRGNLPVAPEGARRHHGGANYAFVDGHVKWFRPEQLRTDPKSDGVHPGFGL